MRILAAARDELEASDFSLSDIEARLNKLLETLDTKPAVLFSLVRIAITGAPFSPALFDSLAILGKKTTRQRIDQALTLLG
jgi:glutamyl-tRNA synthetase